MELGSNTIWWPGLDNHVGFGGVGDGGDHDGAFGDGDGGANYVLQRGRAEPRDPDQEITKSERLHW